MRWHRVILIAGIIALAGGISAAGWALLVYNEATKIDRSNPKVVTAEYLRALLVREDMIGADLYACDDQGMLTSIKALRTELDRREQDFGVTVLVEWAGFERSDTDGRVILSTDLSITAMKGGVEQSSSSQRWRFTLVDNGGWRVCGAEKVQIATRAMTRSPV